MAKGRKVLATGEVAEMYNAASRTVGKWFDGGLLRRGYRIPVSREARARRQADYIPPYEFYWVLSIAYCGGCRGVKWFAMGLWIPACAGMTMGVGITMGA